MASKTAKKSQTHQEKYDRQFQRMETTKQGKADVFREKIKKAMFN